ncbi:unnamed protein product [Polarella glacialis]|uniref:Uncharacterized protein n=1 Tax=Polarella glacialis TaxID=89957 RepID=A0A813EBN6_POLGL|nr:unnamed protein product [Polarella glacialis]
MPLEKRWRPVVAPPSCGEAVVEDWKTHPRLQKHVRRFLDSPDPSKVLSRYAAQAQNLNPEKLLRIAVHVGAWVALLPLEQAAAPPSSEEEDGSQPSPVQLLAEILRLRGRAKISDWLQGVLHLVALRLQDVRLNVQGEAARPWMELRRSTPKAIWRELRTQRPAIPTGGESKSAMLQQSGGPATEVLLASDLHQEISKLGNEKAVRRFHRDGTAFSNSNLEERALHVEGLEERLVKAAASESWDQVCSLIREAAAALAAPRQKAALNDAAVPMPDDAQERLQANLQGRLRKLICKGLGYLDLSDAGTASQLELALAVMKLLIERFKVCGQLEAARAAKQWLRRQGFLTAEATTQAEADLESCRSDGAQITEGKSFLTGEDRGSSKFGVYSPNVKVKSNPLVRNTGQNVILNCNKCGLELRSSWVFEHRGKVSTLVPLHGHATFGAKYVHSDAKISVKLDNPSNLTTCTHGGLERQCVKCGGSQICAHKKRITRCATCRPTQNANGEDWKTHPRLQKHLRRFLDSPDPGRVLSRYSAQAQTLNPEKLLRIAVHVGAWVALLPLEQAAASPSGEEEDASQPSPVQLLGEILRLRGRAKISDWLQGVLHLVALHLQDVRRVAQGQAAKPWMELRRSMPKAIWRELRTQRPAIPTCGESKEQQEPADQVSVLKRKPPPEQTEPAGPEQAEPAGPRAVVEEESSKVQPCGSPATAALLASGFHVEISKFGKEKAVRRFHRDGTAFSNATLEERALYLNSLEERLEKAAAFESWDQVCSLIKEAAAALAAPRQKAALNEAAAPMPEDAQERLRANLQGRLRKLLCKGLSYLDLSDAGTASQLEPALSFMKLLIERFKVRGQLEEARAAKQWLRLQGLLTAEATTQAEANLLNLEPEGSVRRGKGVPKTTYTPNPKIQNNPLVRNTGIGVILTCDKFAPPSCGEATLDDWKAHPRVQKHLQRFLDSPDPGRVLSRYAAQAQNLNPEKLLRIAVHVGAWVALLPLEQAAVSLSGGEEDVSQPSPVKLLAEILRLRGRAKISDWLQGVLHLVALRLQDVRRDVQGQAARPWMELKRSMPKAIWRELRTKRPSIPKCGESKDQQEPADQVPCLKRKPPLEQTEPAGAKAALEAESDMLQQSEVLLASDLFPEISELGHEKAARRFYRDGAAFSNANLEERALHVDGLEERLMEAVASESWDQVCSLIREAAAALAAPLQKTALIAAAAPMPEEAQERLQANLQGQLRKLICKGLAYLDLSDAGTASQLEPALSVMKLLIERFKIRGQLEEAKAAKQWLRLQGLLTALAEADLESSLTEGRVKRRGVLKTTKGGVYTPNPQIQENPLVRNTGNDVILNCNKCGIELRSSWVFEHRGKAIRGGSEFEGGENETAHSIYESAWETHRE